MTQAMELILVIDDDRDLCELLDEYLTREGFWVETAHDGEKGLDKALTGTYGAVVLDVMLPGKYDGHDVLKQMRVRTNTPVLMLTARGDDVDRIVGLVGSYDRGNSAAGREQRSRKDDHLPNRVLCTTTPHRQR